MKIRIKLAILLALLVTIGGVGLVGFLSYLVSTRFLEVEQSLARRDMDRVAQSLHNEVADLETFAKDWAYWDDLWAYTQGRMPHFERSNLTAETYVSGRIAFVAIYDAAGRCCYAFERNARDELVPAAHFPAVLPPSGLPEFRGQGSGIIQMPSGLMLAVCLPILKSDQTGPAAGHLLMGRLLDNAVLDDLSRRVGVPFVHAQPDEAPFAELADGLQGGEVRIESVPHDRTLHGFQLFRTVAGAPALVIRTTTDRLIARASSSLVLTFGIYSLLLASLVGVITWFAFRRWISRPLQRVEEGLATLNLDDDGPEADDALQGLPAGRDEMGHISTALKGMHDRVQLSHREIRHLNESLEAQVEARTEALMKAHQRLVLYGRILENTSEGMLITDANGTILEVNDALCRQSGFQREELLGQNPRIFSSGRHGADFYQALWGALTSTGYWSGEIWDRKPSGEIYPKWLTINAIPGPGDTAPHYVGLSIDITAIKSAEERLHHLAYYDQLTTLPNRSLFMDRLRRVVMRTQRQHLLSALLFLDLDRFKNINDTLGHTVGDALLVHVADRLKSRVRESDTVCRMGGDEFTIILSEIGRLEDAGQVAADLIDVLRKRFDVNGMEIYVGASVGIALCPLDGADEETLIKKADAAMYAAKEGGRSTFRFASGELDAVSRKRMEIESRLHGVLERGELALHFQPLVRATEASARRASGLVGAEALLRWIPSPGVVIGPATFIGIAEDAGLIPEIGVWVIQEACREARIWMDQGLPLYVSVNVSPRQFEDGHLGDVVRAALAASGLPPERLRLEITESAFMRNMDKVVGIMDELRRLGVLSFIDDFGTGFSSLQYIKCLPAHGLKIDKAFVSGVADSLSDAEIVSAIIAMARAFGLTSTAEGVETEDQLHALQERGCDEIQGYLVARPMPSADFLAFARAAAASEPERDHVGQDQQHDDRGRQQEQQRQGGQEDGPDGGASTFPQTALPAGPQHVDG